MIGETVPLRMVGQFGMLSNGALCFGAMLALFGGAPLSSSTLEESSYYWRIVFLYPLVLSAIQVIALTFFYREDSINFLIQEGKPQEAKSLIAKVYKKD